MSAGNMKKQSQLKSTWSGLSQACRAQDLIEPLHKPSVFQHPQAPQINTNHQTEIHTLPAPRVSFKILSKQFGYIYPPRHSPNRENKQRFIEDHIHKQKKRNFPKLMLTFYISPQEVGQRVNDSNRPVTYNRIQGSTSSDPLHCYHSGPPLLSNLLAACLSAWSGAGKDSQCILYTHVFLYHNSHSQLAKNS